MPDPNIQKVQKQIDEWLQSMASTKEDLQVQLPIVCDQYEACAATLGPTDQTCIILNSIKTNMQAELEVLCQIFGD